MALWRRCGAITTRRRRLVVIDPELLRRRLDAIAEPDLVRAGRLRIALCNLG